MITLAFNTVKARKSHTCDFCMGNIEPETHYYRSSHVYEGSAYTWKSHIECSKLVSELQMDGDEGITTEIFFEDVSYEYSRLTEGEGKLEGFDEILDFVITKRLRNG